MTRVSQKSSLEAVRYNLNKTKQAIEDLQIQGASLKKLEKPSDSPINTTKVFDLNAKLSNNKQYVRDAEVAKNFLDTSERALERVNNIISRAKEITIAQSSDFYGPGIRKNVAVEVRQLMNEVLSISNTQAGNRYIFSGFQTDSPPFKNDGTYLGDFGKIQLEIGKNFFIPININGARVFTGVTSEKNILNNQNTRELSTIQKTDNKFVPANTNLFTQLKILANALENNDSKLIQSTILPLDNIFNRIITIRTSIGSTMNSINNSNHSIENENVNIKTQRSRLQDSDIAELFSDLTRLKASLRASYQASDTLINQNLLNFLK